MSGAHVVIGLTCVNRNVVHRQALSPRSTHWRDARNKLQAGNQKKVEVHWRRELQARGQRRHSLQGFDGTGKLPKGGTCA